MSCVTACMTCGVDVPDLGPLKTPYVCDECKRPLFEGNRTLWCLFCGSAHDVTPVGTPPEQCLSCSSGGEWWTRNQRFVVFGTLEAMYAYELAGSEEGARELLRKAPDFALDAICPKCGDRNCTKNHAEFM